MSCSIKHIDYSWCRYWAKIITHPLLRHSSCHTPLSQYSVAWNERCARVSC